MAREFDILSSPIEYLKGVGQERADLLKKELGIFIFNDLLHHFPFRYVDRTSFQKISELTPQTQYVQIVGKILSMHTEGERNHRRLIAVFADETGRMELVWFKGLRWIEKSIAAGKKYIAFGRPNLFRNIYSMPHPELSPFDEKAENAEGRLQAVYPSTEKLKAIGLHSKGIEKLVSQLFSQLQTGDLPENLPEKIIRAHHFPQRFKSLLQVHRPTDEQSLHHAQERLKFEELFIIQLRMRRLKLNRHRHSVGFTFPKLDPHFNEFFKQKLPFELTNAQKRVVKEIRKDLISGKQMNRLLQGDVGSGKTIVSLLIMLMTIDNGFQSCLMAPTEILAQQHFQNITKITAGLDLRLALLTASVKKSERKKVLADLEEGKIDLLIGTHALIEETVKFQHLGLVVIDEQHRFGVEQRAKLWSKNEMPPHILVMTATPIPRTLAMTLYGDLDISTIDELPPGRKPIVTVHRTDSARLLVFGFMKEEIKKGRQVYMVYPLIEESAKQDYKFLMDGYESIVRAFPLPEFAVSIVHGKMKSADRDFEMQRFLQRETNIMVATSVIEVGVDVPNASIMIIESAERFGLSQLHQLRGRVGRGADQSYCILMTGHKLSADARARIRTMTQTNDGFKIADEDLRLRGPGDLEGTQQSGMLIMKIANLFEDQKILKDAGHEVDHLLEEDPQLKLPSHRMLYEFMLNEDRQKGNWSKIS